MNKTHSINRTKKVRPINWTEDGDGKLWADFPWGHVVVRKLKHPSEPRDSWLATLFDAKGDRTINGEYRDNQWSAQIDAEYLYLTFKSMNKRPLRKSKDAVMTLPQVVAWIALNDEPKDMHAPSISGYISVQLAADIFGVRPIHIAKLVSKYRKRAYGE